MDCVEHGSLYLRLVISTLLGAGALIAPASEVNAQSYCNTSGCVVTGPGGGGGGDGWGGGGGWGGGITEDERPQPPPDPKWYCPFLASTKPQNCPNPIPAPQGHDYAKGRFVGGSGMARAIYFVDQQAGVVPAAKDTFRFALSTHTSAIRNRTNPLDAVNRVLIRDLQIACDRQLAASIGPVTNADRACLEIVDRLNAEANNHQSYVSWFINWAANFGINLADWGIPQTVINALSPENSLSRKYEIVTEDAKCAAWWQEVRDSACNL